MSTPNHHASNSLEEQIRVIDRVVKECDQTRKQLEQLTRKVDNLYDEVKHFRDFLQYEKQHRDPALGSLSRQASLPGASPGGHHIDHVIETLSSLTLQLSKEWDDKLEGIRTTQIQHLTSQSSSLM